MSEATEAQRAEYAPEDHPRVWTERYQRGVDRHRDQDICGDHEPCCLCGRPVYSKAGGARYVFVLEDSLVPWDEVSADPIAEYGDFMGDHSIGSDCAATIDPRYVRTT
tara:strand:- start:24 stop:347 length:324 start_codon:yes stop_codon:yes gene_type:complete